MLEKLKEEVYKANMDLQKHSLITFTWGNASGIDREAGIFVIKPSGVPYEELSPDDMVVMDLKGNKVEGALNPSSDMKTHMILYNAFPKIGGIVHTHSSWATSWAQSGRDIPCYGTTHADYFYGAVPCLRNLSEKEINEDYEYNTGILIRDYFLKKDEENAAQGKRRELPNPEEYIAVPCALCRNHGPFAWGKDAAEAVYHAVVLEEVAKMAFRTEVINPEVKPAPKEMQDKHYLRKHGKNAYYGQKK